MSNQPQSCHPDSSLSDHTLNQPANRARRQPSHQRGRVNHLNEGSCVPEHSQPGSLDEFASEQEEATSNSRGGSRLRLIQTLGEQPHRPAPFPDANPAAVPLNSQSETLRRTLASSTAMDPLLTAEEVAERLNVTRDWVWDHSSRKAPHLPVIRMGDGTLRYRASRIEDFIDERERLTTLRRKRG